MSKAEEENEDSFFAYFFPVSRPPSTITSSLHKKLNILPNKQDSNETGTGGAMEHLITWIVELVVFGMLLLVLKRLTTFHLSKSDPVALIQAEEKQVVKDLLSSEKPDEADPNSLVDKAGEKDEDHSDSIRVKNLLLNPKVVIEKRRKWVSIGPIMMAHGRDISPSPEKVVRPPELQEKYQANLQLFDSLVHQQTYMTADLPQTTEIKIPDFIPVPFDLPPASPPPSKTVLTENIYNIKDSNVCVVFLLLSILCYFLGFHP